MHRFYVAEKIMGEGETISLSKEESLHAARVLRLRAGEEIRLLDGTSLYAAELLTVSEQAATARVTALLPSPEPEVKVTLWQGLPKADKLEMIVQKATELGCWEILPVEMARSVAKAGKPDPQGKKQERFRRIALEAAKQSGRAHVPMVREAETFSRLCDEWEKAEGGLACDAVFVAWEEERALPLSRAVKDAWQMRGHGLNRIAVVIGAEGGIAPEEARRLKQMGAVFVTLGKRILRTETAGLCALAVIWAALGEM